MTQDEITDFLVPTRDAARAAQHIWPEFAACEAALESAWGTSTLAIKGKNLFGEKQSTLHPRFQTLDLPTHEWLHGAMVPVMAHWVSYPELSDCFADRMSLLRSLSTTYPHYAAALGAPDGETFVQEVSKTWSTDPNRADKVLAIYNAHKGVF